MDKNSQDSEPENIQKMVTFFFPQHTYAPGMVEKSIQAGELFINGSDMLPYLQTALLDEKIVEVEFDGLDRVYFSRIYDDLPDPVETEVDGETALVIPEYDVGDYLKKQAYLIVLPIEPGLGNHFIRYSKKITLRLFTSSYGVEFGVFFDEITLVEDLPVLRLSFPAIGRVVRDAREFRAKVPDDMGVRLIVIGRGRRQNMETTIRNISASGMSFALEKHERSLFRVDEMRTFQIFEGEDMLVSLNGVVRHVSKVRGKKIIEYSCGIQFDLVTRALAATVETLVASVQRAHLKELAEKSAASGIDLIL